MSFYHRQANNAFGVFIVCAILLVLTVGLDHAHPNGATGSVQGLLAVVGIAALAVNLWFRTKTVSWLK